MYYHGTRNIKVNKGNKKVTIEGIKPKSEFAYKNLERAIRIRERGLIYNAGKIK